MDARLSELWILSGTALHFAGACAVLVLAGWLMPRRERFGPAGVAIVGALALTASWCLAVLSGGTQSAVASLAESVRNLAWLVVVWRLFVSDGRHASVKPVQPMIGALALVEMLQPGLMLLAARGDITVSLREMLFHVAVMFRLLVAIGGLVLAHNLYVGASQRARLALRWPTAALAVLWGYDLNLYTIAYLADDWPHQLAAVRGAVPLCLAALLAIGAAKGREDLRLRPSRAVTFQSVSLMLIGAYLLLMVGIAEWLSVAHSDFARVMQIGFVLAASVLALLVMPSRRMRGWLKVTITKHLFQHRYDYRAEWLRFTQTMGQGGDSTVPLEERVVQAIADITDSPAGLLLTAGDHGEQVLAARWQWPTADVPAVALDAAAAAFLEREGFILDLDDIRAGLDHRGESAVVPAWLRDEPRAWAVVPLVHFERLAGVVVLARPLHARKLDWEDFDLLRVAGKQLASYLAEHAGAAALAEAARFDDFHRRIAFVMHDIKNLASQLSLLARNAEMHAENPDFRADMLITLRNSADKLNALLVRLSRYGPGTVDQVEPVRADAVAQAVVDQFRGRHPVALTRCEPCEVSANRHSLDQVLVHLVQNAVDASAAEAPVFVTVTSDGINGRIEVIDSGCGMSPDFVRTKLFKPFVSSKQGGFGIGAFEARELVRAMRGRLEVESREGLGTRFTIRLPLELAASAAATLEASKDQKVA